MMHNFLANNRSELIERCKAKVAQRPLRAATPKQLQNGVPMFLEQLIKTLRVEQTTRPLDSREISGPSDGETSMSEVGTSAAQHGRELLSLGYTVDQVVHDYGDLCQSITDLAFERDAPFQIDEFRTLNRCLDNAIADAVTEFSYQRDSAADEKRTIEANQQAGFFAHELRNALGTASLAFVAAKAGNLSFSGATGSILERSLIALGELIDQSLTEIYVTAGKTVHSKMFSLAEFIDEVKLAAELLAQVKGCKFTVSLVDEELAISGDRNLLYAAVGNLVQNALKFTHAHTEVTLNAYAVADRILVDVKDHCGGLPAGEAEKMFLPFTQNSDDKSGLGLGLSIARRSVESNDGTLSVRDVPGTGCIFTINMPRYSTTAQKS
ncbi:MULTISPECIES: sensor histidine kinase [Burkholderiaceae]|uniref:histidine kinase n=1 Tax=Caballeronia sordidicola TaxID=196367 RepID=A0A242ML93_CABSO|nr:MULTISPECIES: HAMP domain-containing sensor histidine kinase [Burkholderiaceae]OTP72096.1 Two-component hybrid sensor and regulator [Caballeronia sordidicola]